MHIEHKPITHESCKDSGLALVLICLLCFMAWDWSPLLILAVLFLLLVMTFPGLFRPFAKLWFAFSTLLGTIVSKVILAVLFFFLVTPVGLVRRIIGKDAMQLRGWKKNRTSVFRTREHEFCAKDLETPY